MDTNQRNVGPVTILELGPRLTIAEGYELRERVKALLAQGRKGILFDCGRVSVIDSQGVGALVRIWMAAGMAGKLKLFGLPPHLKRVLRITGLLRVMDCFDDAGSALRSS